MRVSVIIRNKYCAARFVFVPTVFMYVETKGMYGPGS
uniref:Uncharacterized protein n=1 Tax=Arundo donax TaxID=35708 RepID=A0A0A9ABZ7_ARUDO